MATRYQIEVTLDEDDPSEVLDWLIDLTSDEDASVRTLESVPTGPANDKEAIRQTIVALRKAGYTLPGGHDSDDFFKVAPDVDVDELVEILTAGDESTLHTFKEGEQPPKSFIYFVLGNAPYEVICDHGVSLSDVLDPLTESWED